MVQVTSQRHAEESQGRGGNTALLGLILLLGLAAPGPCQEVAPSSFATDRILPPPASAPAVGASSRLPNSTDQSSAIGEPKAEEFLIDLPTALRLADVQNPQIQFARERIRAAEA